MLNISVKDGGVTGVKDAEGNDVEFEVVNENATSAQGEAVADDVKSDATGEPTTPADAVVQPEGTQDADKAPEDGEGTSGNAVSPAEGEEAVGE